MRHRVAHRKLGRVTEHRIAMLRNQAQALLKFERIETTVPRAKELRPFVERIITIAKRGLAGGEENGRSLHARRMVLRDIHDRDVVGKLFDTIAPRFEARPGGYTRILGIGYRRGDSAEVAQIELVGSEYDPNQRRKPARPPRRSRRRRASAAACVPRPNGCAASAKKTRATRLQRSPRNRPAPAREKSGRTDTRGKGQKTSAPRKAGGQFLETTLPSSPVRARPSPPR